MNLPAKAILQRCLLALSGLGAPLSLSASSLFEIQTNEGERYLGYLRSSDEKGIRIEPTEWASRVALEIPFDRITRVDWLIPDNGVESISMREIAGWLTPLGPYLSPPSLKEVLDWLETNCSTRPPLAILLVLEAWPSSRSEYRERFQRLEIEAFIRAGLIQRATQRIREMLRQSEDAIPAAWLFAVRARMEAEAGDWEAARIFLSGLEAWGYASANSVLMEQLRNQTERNPFPCPGLP